MGGVKSVHDLERAVGILSYYHRSVMATGRILAPLYQALKVVKQEGSNDVQWGNIEGMVKKAFGLALENVKDKKVLGREIKHFILYTDWADGFGGYMLEAE